MSHQLQVILPNKDELKQKVVIASYTAESYFLVPKHISINEDNYTVKWGKLFITDENGKEIEIEQTMESEIDYKFPNDTRIEDADDYEFLHTEEAVVSDDDEDYDEVNKWQQVGAEYPIDRVINII
jgi:hypothetical protein